MATRLTRSERQEQTRLLILDAALGVFRRSGFAKATMDEIAELAGCTRGTVYLHFGTKEGLLVAVVEHHAPDAIEAFRAQVTAARSSKALMRLLLATERLTPDGQITSVLNQAALLSSLRTTQDDDLLARSAALLDQVEGEYAFLLERLCVLRGVQSPLSARRLAVLALALRDGLLLRAALVPGTQVEREFTLAVDLLLGDRV